MKVVLFGVGAIGSNLFVSLIKQFPDWNYVGIDFDVVEARNLRTQTYFREHVGQPKASALMAVGMRYVQKLDYTPLKIKITEQHLNKSGYGKKAEKELWIDCFDNSESRKLGRLTTYRASRLKQYGVNSCTHVSHLMLIIATIAGITAMGDSLCYE